MASPSTNLFRICSMSGPPQWFLEEQEHRKRLRFDTTDAFGGRCLYHPSMGRIMGVASG